MHAGSPDSENTEPENAMCKTDVRTNAAGDEATPFAPPPCTCNLLPCMCMSEWSACSLTEDSEYADLYSDPGDDQQECSCGLLPCICTNWMAGSVDAEVPVTAVEPAIVPQSPSKVNEAKPPRSKLVSPAAPHQPEFRQFLTICFMCSGPLQP